MDDTAKQEAEQAVPFTTAFDIPEVLEEVKSTAATREELAIREEKLILENIDSEFWQLVKKRLQLRIQTLRSAPAVRLTNGKLDLQEIGFRAIIVNEVADALQDIINLVELPKKKREAQIADEKQKEGEENE